MKRPVYIGIVLLGLTACEAPYQIKVQDKAQDTVQAPAAADGAVETISETWGPYYGSKKRIDFVLVIDNSGSMGDNQAKLASELLQIANTFFYDRTLDICPVVITSDRYLGRSGREFAVSCSNPDGMETASDAQHRAYVDAIKLEFANRVNVGVSGSAYEYLGASLATFLFDQDQWNGRSNSFSTALGTTRSTSLLRANAITHVAFFTDENNSSVDLPAVQDSQRTGIKDYLDLFFGREGRNPGYSVSSFIDVTIGPNNTATLRNTGARNLFDLVSAVGRKSALADLQGNAQSFANALTEIFSNLVDSFTTITTQRDIAGELSLAVVSADQSRRSLQEGPDYAVQLPRSIVLSPSALNGLSMGDRIELQYLAVK